MPKRTRKVPRVPHELLPGGDHDRALDIYEERREAAERRRLGTYDPLHIIPHPEPGEFKQVLKERLENIGDSLTGAGYGISDFILRQKDGPEMRESAAFIQEVQQVLGEYTKALKQSKKAWEREAAEILERIIKLPEVAAHLYKYPPEYPVGENYEKYGKDNAEAAREAETRRAMQNQAISLYYLSILNEISKLNVTNHSKRFKRHIDALMVKISEVEGLKKSASECKRQYRLAKYQYIQNQERNKESRADSRHIQSFYKTSGIKDYVTRHRIMDFAEKFEKRADARAAELEEFLADFSKHQQDTLAKIVAYRSQAQKRMNANTNSIARQNDFTVENGILARSTNRVNNAIREVVDAAYLSNVIDSDTPAGLAHSLFSNVAQREHDRLTAAAMVPRSDLDNGIITDLSVDEREKREQIPQIVERATEAETRTEEAKKRAREAETRARIAHAHHLSNEAANNTAKHANKVAELEEKVAKIIRKIQSNNEIIANAFLDMNTIFDEMNAEYIKMDAMINNPGRRLPDVNQENIRITGIKGSFGANFQRLVNQVKAAEERKNSAIKSDEKLTTEELKLLTDIHNELVAERNSLVREHQTEIAIANLANKPANTDMAILNNLERRQRELEAVLVGAPGRPGLIEKERLHARSIGRIRDAINRQVEDITNMLTPTGRVNLKNSEQGQRITVNNARFDFQTALSNLQTAEMEAEIVIKDNTTQIGGELPSDADRVVEALQQIKDKQTAQDGKRQEELSKDSLIFIYPKSGRCTIGNDATWMYVREIGDPIPKPDYSQKSTGKSRFNFRGDIAKIESNIITRDAKAVEIEPIYTKRHNKRTFNSPDIDYTLEVTTGPGYAGGGRRQAVLMWVERTKIGTRKPAATEGSTNAIDYYTEAECTHYQYVENMEGVTKIRIIENHNKPNAPAVEFIVDRETMPDPNVDHAITASRRQGTGWSLEDRSQAWVMDLDAHVLRLPNGLEFGLDLFDWDDTGWDEKNGLTLRFRGPKELWDFNLGLVAAFDACNPMFRDAMNALRKMKRKNFNEKIEWLKQSVKTCNGQEIKSAFGLLQGSETKETYLSALAKYELQRPPQSRFEWKDFRKKYNKKGLPQWVTDFTKSATEIYAGRRNYENKIKERTRTINTATPLTTDYVLRYRAQPEKFHISKHKSSKEKLKLWNEISTANGLDKRVDFNLLEDPRPILTVTKNASPNGLELLQEYNMYKDTEHIADPVERQRVEDYVADIAYQLETRVPVYWRNAWKLQRAMDAASEGNLLGKTVNGGRIPGAKDYIQELVQGDCPLEPKSIAELRQADEYHWVTYMRNALGKVDSESIPQVLEQALSFAHCIQVSRFNNLECAKKALDLETPTEEVEKILSQMSIEDSLSSLYETNKQEKSKVDIKDKLVPNFEDWFKGKSEPEMMQDIEKVTKEVADVLGEAVQNLIESTNDIGLKTKYKEAGPKILEELMKTHTALYKQRVAIAVREHDIDKYFKKLDQQWWKDLFANWAFLWIKNEANFGSKIAQNILGKILNLAELFIKD